MQKAGITRSYPAFADYMELRWVVGLNYRRTPHPYRPYFLAL